MIFAAGLAPVSSPPGPINIPKPWHLVNGKSALQRNIEYLQQDGIRDVMVVNASLYRPDHRRGGNEQGAGESRVLISDETDAVLENRRWPAQGQAFAGR